MNKKTKKKIKSKLKKYWIEVRKIRKKLKVKTKKAQDILKLKPIALNIKKKKQEIQFRERSMIINELVKNNIEPNSVIGQIMIKSGIKEIIRKKVEEQLQIKGIKRFRYYKDKVYDYKNKKYVTRKKAEQIKKRLRRTIRIKENMKRYYISHFESERLFDAGYDFYRYSF